MAILFIRTGQCTLQTFWNFLGMKVEWEKERAGSVLYVAHACLGGFESGKRTADSSSEL